MSLFITALASGSNGNCYYVGNETEAVLIDAGITCKEIEKRMNRLGLSIKKVKAVFVSHEHADHIKGIPVLTKKYTLPTYITTTTLRFGRLRLEKNCIRSFIPNEPVKIGNLSVTAFSKMHDASDPCSFTVSENGTCVGVFTDIGSACSGVIHHFSQCHAAFLEANYDEHMLQVGGYPYYLKKRISGEKGHLSNKQALALFTTHRPYHMSHLFLSHLSKNNNCPNLVSELFNKHAGGTKIIVASRYKETAVYAINATSPSVKLQHAEYKESFGTEQLTFAF